MDDAGFHSFCYDEYKRSTDAAESMYQRYPFAVTIIAVLTAAAIGIGTNERWSDFLIRVDVTVYYSMLSLTFGLLACSTTFLTSSIVPKAYEQLESTSSFRTWREGYRKQLQDDGIHNDKEIEDAVAVHTRAEITKRLCEATEFNLLAARRRMKQYNWSVYALSGAVTCLSVAALACWAIQIKGPLHDKPETKPAAAPAATARP